MPFSAAFQLFGGGGYVNFESMGEGLSGISTSGGGFTPSQFFGLVGGGGNFLQSNLANLGFIVDTVTRERLAFQYNVDSKEKYSANYQTHEPLARSNPIYQYKGGKERVLDLPIVFTMKENSRDDVLKSVRWLQSLLYPDYDGNEASLAPHPVVVVQGQLYTQDTWLVKEFSVEWGPAKDPVTQIPSEATVNLNLVEISENGRSSAEIIRL